MAWQTDLWRTVVALLLKLVFICAELLGAMRDALGSLWPASESAFDAAATEELLAPLARRLSPPEPRGDLPLLAYDDYAAQAQTGDLLLFCADTPLSKLVRALENGTYQHTAIVVKAALPGEDEAYAEKLRVLMATCTAQVVDFRDHHGVESNEVMLVDLARFLRNEETVVVRRVVCDDARKRADVTRKVVAVAADTLGRPYNLTSHRLKERLEVVESLALPGFVKHRHWFDRKTYDTYVCSTLAAHTLIAADVLNSDKHPLGSDYYFSFPSLLDEEHLSEADDFAAGVALGPEVRLENPWDPRILSRARRRWAALRATFRAGRPASPAWAPPTSTSSVIETAT